MKPIKGKYGYLQGTCGRCSESDLPLIRYKNEVVCDTCRKTIKRVELSKKQIKNADKDSDFISRIING